MKEIICYTAPEAAKLLKIDKTTLYGLIKSERLRAVKIGRTYRIAETELERFLTGIPIPNDGK